MKEEGRGTCASAGESAELGDQARGEQAGGEQEGSGREPLVCLCNAHNLLS